jgi:hypothetical protein
MRKRHGTVAAMEQLVRSGEIQSGFIRLKKRIWPKNGRLRLASSNFLKDLRAKHENARNFGSITSTTKA